MEIGCIMYIFRIRERSVSGLGHLEKIQRNKGT